MPGGAEPSTLGNPEIAKVQTRWLWAGLCSISRCSVSHGVRTHAQLPAVDLKSTPLTTRADSHVPAANLSSKLVFWHSSFPGSDLGLSFVSSVLLALSSPWLSCCLSPLWGGWLSCCLSPLGCLLLLLLICCWPHVLSSWVLVLFCHLRLFVSSGSP